MKKNLIIIAFLVALLLIVTLLLVNINQDLIEINETLERQLVLNEQQNAFNILVAEQAVTRDMLQTVLDNFYDHLMEKLLK